MAECSGAPGQDGLGARDGFHACRGSPLAQAAAGAAPRFGVRDTASGPPASQPGPGRRQRRGGAGRGGPGEGNGRVPGRSRRVRHLRRPRSHRQQPEPRLAAAPARGGAGAEGSCTLPPAPPFLPFLLLLLPLAGTRSPPCPEEARF